MTNPNIIIKDVSYEDGMKIAEQYKWFERKIAEQQKHLEKIYELIAGEDAIKRFTPEEMIEYIEVLNEQIAEWESETHESFMPEEETNNV